MHIHMLACRYNFQEFSPSHGGLGFHQSFQVSWLKYPGVSGYACIYLSHRAEGCEATAFIFKPHLLSSTPRCGIQWGSNDGSTAIFVVPTGVANPSLCKVRLQETADPNITGFSFEP